MALVTMLVEVERVKMAVVCRSAGTVAHLGIDPKRLDTPEVLC